MNNVMAAKAAIHASLRGIDVDPSHDGTKMLQARRNKKAALRGGLSVVRKRLKRRIAYVFIDWKNSPLVLVERSLSIRNSMASIVPIGLRMRRST
jgi:hypothetical protein